MTQTPFTPFTTGSIGPLTRVTPFTYRDNATFQRILFELIKWLNDTQLNQIQAEMQKILDEFQAALDSQQLDIDTAKQEWDTRFDQIMADLQAEITALNNTAVAGMVTTNGNPVRNAILALIDAAVETLNDQLQADIQAAKDELNKNGYVVATFTGDDDEGEKLSLFYSADGKSVSGGASNPAYAPADGQGLRDPSLIMHNGKWYVTYTSNNGIDKDFQIAVSDSGVAGSWSILATVNASSIPDTFRIWAPEFVVAPDGIYIFFSRIRQSNQATGSMFWIKATNDALTTWTGISPVNWTAEPAHYIDGIPVLHTDGKWYLFASTGNDIIRANATTISGPYTLDKSGNWAGFGTGIEGPYISKDGSTYRIYFDRYVAGSGIAWSESTDLTTWSVPVNLVVSPNTLQGGQKIRHGSFYRVPDPVGGLQLLGGQLSPGLNRSRHTELISVPGPSTTNAVEVKANGWAVDTNETTEDGLVSFDAAGNITFLHAGVYALTCATSPTGVTGVTRTYTDFQNVDGPPITHLRIGHGAEDVMGAPFPNFKTAQAGERMSIGLFAQWTGGQPTATFPIRLRIDLISTY